MPRITTPLAVNYQNIQLPVATQIARDVMKVCGINENTPLYMMDEFDSIKQRGSGPNAETEINFNSSSQLIVTAKDTLQNESITNQTVRTNDQPPYLEDRRLGFSVRPVMLVSNLQLTFKYRASSRREAQAWRDEQAVRKAEYRQAMHHEINYNVPIHDGVLALVAEIHSLREKIAGYGESFPEYFNSIAKMEFSADGAPDGDVEKLTTVVPFKQDEISGWFEFDEIPQETKKDQSSAWEIEFTYNIRYNRCTHLYLAYPLMVHQSLISNQYFSKERRFGLEDMEMNGSIGLAALHQVLKRNEMPPLEATTGMRFPHWDEWMPGYRKVVARTVPAATWMISLDPKDTQDIINLEQIPNVRFTLEQLTYMKSTFATLGRKGGASLLFTLYSDSVPMSERLLTIDKDLNVRTVVPLDLRKQYHLRLNFPTLYSDFTPEALIGISEHPEATFQIFQSMVYALDVEKAREKYVSEGWLSRDYVKWFYGYLYDHGRGSDGNPANDGTGGSNTTRPGPGNDNLPGGSIPGTGGIGGNGGDGSFPGGGVPGSGPGGGGGTYHWVGGRWVQWLAVMTKRGTKAED
jgi:hypothetical protein